MRQDEYRGSVNASVQCGKSDQDDYTYLIPLQCRYAQLAPDDPQRQPLRDQLIRGYLPLAINIARRFAGRGEPPEDLIQIATIGLIQAVDRFEPELAVVHDPRLQLAGRKDTRRPGRPTLIKTLPSVCP